MGAFIDPCCGRGSTLWQSDFFLGTVKWHCELAYQILPVANETSEWMLGHCTSHRVGVSRRRRLEDFHRYCDWGSDFCFGCTRHKIGLRSFDNDADGEVARREHRKNHTIHLRCQASSFLARPLLPCFPFRFDILFRSLYCCFDNHKQCIISVKKV